LGSGPIAWEREVEIGGLTIRPHFTKIERKEESGFYFYYLAPRIGIDFIEKRKWKPMKYSPNLDVGDVIRIVKVLELLERNPVYQKLRDGSINPFEIALTFRRKIVIDSGRAPNSLRLEYYNRNGRHPLFKTGFSRIAVADLKRGLRTLVALYLALVQMWRTGHKLPKPFVHTEKIR
jgi:hypothetical protein